MTDKQYLRFTGLIKALFDTFNPKKNMFRNKIVIVIITDSLGEFITFKLRKKANVSEEGLRMLIGNRLKDLEKLGKRLDLDNKCNIDLKTIEKVKRKKCQPPKKQFNKNFRRGRR